MSDGPTPPVLLTRDPGEGPERLSSYVAADGYAALCDTVGRTSPQELVQLVTDADLRGRGGAAFPAGRKWQIAHDTAADQKYVVANGGEHEPGSRKDRVLVATRPHLVLEGMALCGFATGASKGYLYLIEDMAESIASAERAIDEALMAGHLGENVYESDFSFEVEIHKAPTTYVAGEETAALASIEGQSAKPRQKPPYPGESGLHGKPTTVNNVETLAHVPGIVRFGADWFRSLGVAGSAGTMCFTLDETFVNPGVYELPYGATFRDLFEGKGGGLPGGGGVAGKLKAILPALSCAFLPGDALDLPLDHATLQEHGSTLGCGGVSVILEGQCIVERVCAIADFFVQEQCGQCSPCRMETSTIAAVLKRVRTGQGGEYQAQIQKICDFARGKGWCSLIEMAATPVLSALRLFPDDFVHHAAHGTCPA